MSLPFVPPYNVAPDTCNPWGECLGGSVIMTPCGSGLQQDPIVFCHMIGSIFNPIYCAIMVARGLCVVGKSHLRQNYPQDSPLPEPSVRRLGLEGVCPGIATLLSTET